jgi:hypothetical protein
LVLWELSRRVFVLCPQLGSLVKQPERLQRTKNKEQRTKNKAQSSKPPEENVQMFCPTCEAEYEPGITRCPDDESELVERLTPENTVHDSSEARLVPLHRLGSPAEAEMVNDILIQNGIRSMVKAGGADAFSSLLSNSDGAVILVDERDSDRALEIYKAFFGGDTTPLTGGPTEDEEQ